MMIARFWSIIDTLQTWHAAKTDKGWLKPVGVSRRFIGLLLLSALLAAAMNGYVRHSQYNVWEQNSQIFYLDDGTPLFTTTDAPFFLGIAQAMKRDGDFNNFFELRSYPIIKQAFEAKAPVSNIRNTPLLSVVLSQMASESSVKALLEAGHRLITITAILTALMIVFAFGAAGYWLEGSIAAAGGGLSLAYLQRSGAGRIDTDQLNLGFFYLMTGLVIVAARAKTFRAALVLAALAGTIYWVFDWWYGMSFFGWAFFIGFIWLSLVCRSDMKRIILQSVLFLALSGLPFKGLGISGESSYLNDVSVFEGLIFPNTFDTISEMRQVPFGDILVRISGSVWLGFLSLLGLALWGLRHPALAIVFGPATAFALLNFIIGNRAIFYSAPMIWFGFGWLVITGFRWAGEKLPIAQHQIIMTAIATIAGFVSVWLASPTNLVQPPTFDRETVADFQKLQRLPSEERPVLVSWWDYGYMSMFINGLPTLHDGGAQTMPTTYFIANKLIGPSQEQAATVLKQLVNHSYIGVIRELYKNIEVKNTQTAKHPAKQNTAYLVLTKDMARWMGSISTIGAWDIEKGKRYRFSGVNAGYQLNYEELTCKATNTAQIFDCNGNKLNLVSGQLGPRAILDGMAVTKDGFQTGERKFPQSNTPFVLHSEMGAGGPKNMLMHRDLYFSVFHQLFYLNKPDLRYFQLIYDGFPNMRVFKVL